MNKPCIDFKDNRQGGLYKDLHLPAQIQFDSVVNHPFFDP